jgi:arsenate reductase
MGRPTVYHYPRSKSSYGAIRLLEACSLKPIIIDITVDPLLPRDVERFMAELGIDDPRDFMRTRDPLYAELNLHDPALGRDALIQAIIDHPRLMRRPVVDLPYREQGQRRRALVVAQPPQKLFSVILNESEEEALGLATPRPLEETEADRWARQWSQAEVLHTTRARVCRACVVCVVCAVCVVCRVVLTGVCFAVVTGPAPARPGAGRRDARAAG